MQKYRKEQKCDKESWQDCKNQPYEKCNKITHNNCKNVCKDVPYQVHSKEPKQITRRRPFRVCNGSKKFTEFRKLSMSIHEKTINEKLIKEGCIVPNCNQRKFVRTAESLGRRKPVCMFCCFSLLLYNYL